MLVMAVALQKIDKEKDTTAEREVIKEKNEDGAKVANNVEGIRIAKIGDDVRDANEEKDVEGVAEEKDAVVLNEDGGLSNEEKGVVVRNEGGSRVLNLEEKDVMVCAEDGVRIVSDKDIVGCNGDETGTIEEESSSSEREVPEECLPIVEASNVERLDDNYDFVKLSDKICSENAKVEKEGIRVVVKVMRSELSLVKEFRSWGFELEIVEVVELGANKPKCQVELIVVEFSSIGSA